MLEAGKFTWEGDCFSDNMPLYFLQSQIVRLKR